MVTICFVSKIDCSKRCDIPAITLTFENFGRKHFIIGFKIIVMTKGIVAKVTTPSSNNNLIIVIAK